MKTFDQIKAEMNENIDRTFDKIKSEMDGDLDRAFRKVFDRTMFDFFLVLICAAITWLALRSV